MEKIDIGKSIKAIRESKKLSQIDISTQIGLDNSTYARIEKKGNKIDFDTILSIASALNVTVYDVIGDTASISTQKYDEEISNLNGSIKKRENEFALIIGTYIDFLNSAVEHRFCLSYFNFFNEEKVFQDINRDELLYIYQNDLCNDYLVFNTLKKGLIQNPTLNKIHSDFLTIIEKEISNGKKYTDFIKIKIFHP